MLNSRENKIEVGIYHKPSTTMRTITSDSNTHIQHKHAAYHFLAYRLCRLPLNIYEYMKEFAYMKYTAKVNGYSVELVEKMVRIHSRKVRSSNLTTLYSQREIEQKQRMAINFVSQITNKLKPKLNEFGFDLVYKSENKLLNLLCSNRTKKPPLSKSGIYMSGRE